jgi:AraC-like DNA-binding protein
MRQPWLPAQMTRDDGFFGRLASPRFCERLFAYLPDVVFCLKDHERRYQAANAAFAARLGLADPDLLIGRLADDFFPAALAAVYREQDLQVLGNGREICDRLELVTQRDGPPGWYLATKVPLHDAAGNIIGLASISRDLRTPSGQDLELSGLAKIVSYIQQHLDEPLQPVDLAAMATLSLPRLDRRMRRVFQLTTSQFIRKSRIDHAVQLLTTSSMPISEIAFSCGYGDQSAFTRQFRSTVGLPPAAYRSLHGWRPV